MPNYRRWYVSGGTYFFTAVLHQRRPLFSDARARQILRDAIHKQQEKRPFTLFASVLLPEHFHCVWILPRGDSDYSTRWSQIKEEFTRNFLASGGTEGVISTSRKRRRERGVWQRRFWEHTIEDEEDLKNCVDYIHWNPVKHGLVTRVRDWEYSSFHRFVEQGEYDLDWGRLNPCEGQENPDWEP